VIGTARSVGGGASEYEVLFEFTNAMRDRREEMRGLNGGQARM